MIRSVTVYCSSSSKVAAVFHDAAAELGRAVAGAGWGLVYGGNAVGLMGVVADAARAGGGRVVGVTPRLFVEKGVHDRHAHELVVTACMRDRKRHMEQRGDAFVALPGGLGTLEEIFEIITGKQLGYHDKAVVLLNTAGFYDPLLAMIDRGVDSGFVRPKARELYHVATTVFDAIAYLHAHVPNVPSGTSFEIEPRS